MTTHTPRHARARTARAWLRSARRRQAAEAAPGRADATVWLPEAIRADLAPQAADELAQIARARAVHHDVWTGNADTDRAWR